jgi:hypothetical protein
MRTMIRRWISLVISVAAGCSSGEKAEAPPPIDDANVELRTQPYTLQPGEEKYFCYAMNLPDSPETAIVRLSPAYGRGTHHIIFAQTLAPEPDGFTECAVLFRTSWVPLYIGGVDSGPLTLPEGSGFPLKAAQQVLIQLHLQNTTTAPITDTTAMKLKMVKPDTLTTKAGVFGLDNRNLQIPAHGVGIGHEMSCSPSRAMNVFAVLGHMHKQGRELALWRAPNQMLYQAAWNFDQQPVTPLPLRIEASDSLKFRCLHDNPNGQPIVYGESSDQEMCALILYYTPFESLAGCIQLPPPDGTGGAGGGGGADAGGAGAAGNGGAGGAGAGSGGAAGSSGAAGAGAMPADAAADVTGIRDATGVADRSDAPANGACTNGADQGVIGNTAKFEQDITDCGTACFFLPGDKAVCATDCMHGKGLSSGCAGCYGGQIACGMVTCSAPCMANSSSPECRSCVMQNCEPPFRACAGDPPMSRSGTGKN